MRKALRYRVASLVGENDLHCAFANILITTLMLISIRLALLIVDLSDLPATAFTIALVPRHAHHFGVCIAAAGAAFLAGLVGETCFHGTRRRRWLVVFAMLYIFPYLYWLNSWSWYDFQDTDLPPGVIEIYFFDWQKVVLAACWMVVIPTLIVPGALLAAKFRSYAEKQAVMPPLDT